MLNVIIQSKRYILQCRRWWRLYAPTKRLNQLLTLFLIYLTYQCIKITIASFTYNEPLWHITRYRIGEYFYKNNDLQYFQKSDEFEWELDHEDIRDLLKIEYLKKLKVSGIDFDQYFQSLELKNQEVEKLDFYGLSFEDFMLKYAKIIEENKISFPHPERTITNKGAPVIWDTLFVDDAYSRLSENDLSKIMEFDETFLKDLKLKHDNILKSLPIDEKCTYFEGSGYVFIGGGIYTWYSLLSIISLRKTGSVLPIELIIPHPTDRDSLICAAILPRVFNTKCVLMEDKYSKETIKKLPIRGYQIKSMAILASSFENVMYLDSDVFTVENPDLLFTSELFKQYGMITWPDFWRRTTSPLLYDTLNIQVGDKPIRFLNDYFTPSELLYPKKDLINVTETVNYHDLAGTLPDWSTEAGLMLINKNTHINTLLLSLYYNMNGPAGYYPLLSQGGAGEGDKETLVLAAHVLNEPWWQVNTQPGKTYGTWIKERNWIVDTCIVQVDALEDWEGTLGLVWTQDHWRNEMIERGGYVYNYDYSFGKNGYDYLNIMGEDLSNKGNDWIPMYEKKENHHTKPMLQKPRDMFYHLHSPKLDPWNYVLDNLFTDLEGRQMRNFGDLWVKLGWDFELWIWETVRELLCVDNKKSINGISEKDLELLQLAVSQMKAFKGRNFDDICKGEGGRLNSRIEWLRKDGINKLKKEGEHLHGWKLNGKERDRVKKIVDDKWGTDSRSQRN